MEACRRAVTIAFAFCAFASLTVPAAAHAVLEASSPAAGQWLERSPAQIVLTFDEPVETSLGSLRVLDASGRVRSASGVVHPDGDPARIAIRPAALERGRYVVAWRVISADSHVVGGAYAFGIGVPAGDAPPIAADPAGASYNAVVHGLLLAAALLAMGLPIGAVAFGRATASATLAEFAAWFALALAAFADVAVRAELDGGSLADSCQTLVGTLRALTIAAGIFGALSLVGRRRNWFGLVPSGVLLVLSLSAAGHAADGALPWFGIAADAVHVTAAACWIGVIAVGISLGPSALLAKISPVAMASVAAIVVTGIVQAIRDVGGWQPMIATTYGRVLDTKIVLLLVALAIAWSARRSIARGSFALRRRLLAEFGVLVAVIALTSVLVDLPLPRDEAAAAQAVSALVRVRDIDVTIAAQARDARHWTLTVAGRGPDGAVRALDGVEATATETVRHTGPLAVPMVRTSSGGYAGDVSLPFAGSWSAFVSVRSGDFDEGHATVPLAETRP